MDESVWSALKSPVMAATKGVAKTLDYVAPELTNPIKNVGNAVKDIGRAVKQGLKGTEGYIKSVLQNQGYRVSQITKSGNNYVAVVNELHIDSDGNQTYDPNTKRLVVDGEGNRVNYRASTSNIDRKKLNNSKTHH